MVAKKGAQPGNTLAKVGRGWEDLMPRAVGQVDGLKLEHFGAPTRIIGMGSTKGGRRAPLVAFEGPAPLDWSGHYRGRHCEIDCKRMSVPGTSWSFVSAMSIDQVSRCCSLQAAGCMVGIALLIDAGFVCYGIPWRLLARLRATGRASVKLIELEDALAAGQIVSLRPHDGPVDLRQFVALLAKEG